MSFAQQKQSTTDAPASPSASVSPSPFPSSSSSSTGNSPPKQVPTIAVYVSTTVHTVVEPWSPDVAMEASSGESLARPSHRASAQRLTHHLPQCTSTPSVPLLRHSRTGSPSTTPSRRATLPSHGLGSTNINRFVALPSLRLSPL
jgi:hypothetical protein